MKSINVSLKSDLYKIMIGSKILPDLGRHLKSLSIGKDAIVITHPVLNKLYGKQLVAGLKKHNFSVKVLTVPQGEQSKSAKEVFKLIEQIARYDVLKKVFIIAFGGGVIGDLAGYVAASYKRGIPYIQVPTTFLAQIDSSIGGKVGVDLPQGKNLVGAFHQPKLVLSDVSLLKTLPKRQMISGLAEAIKYGVIRDRKFFSYLEKNYSRVISCDTSVLLQVVNRCARIKTDIVLADEKETKGIRTILNFGHTVGHAVEAAAGYNFYQHGEAIGLGMRAAVDVSFRLRLVSSAEVEQVNELITKAGLPVKICKVGISKILAHMRHDKKFISGKMRFVLATKIGKVIVRDGIPPEVITSAIKRLM